ncbi:MAG: hypothetical protein KJ077_10325 [Anaerolineae bacterium]|nr:hypothetical protein [Anaerolineae bacterium]
MTYLELAGYYLVLAVVIAIEHVLFYRRWRRREWARWALGILTVFSWAAPLALSGNLDLRTVIILFVAFGLAGVIKGGMDIDRETSEADRGRREIAEKSNW